MAASFVFSSWDHIQPKIDGRVKCAARVRVPCSVSTLGSVVLQYFSTQTRPSGESLERAWRRLLAT